MRFLRLPLLLALALLISLWPGSGAAQDDAPRLQSVLAEMAALGAKDLSHARELAREHGLPFHNDRLLVVVEGNIPAVVHSLETLDVQVGSVAADRVSALVAPSDLLALATLSDVSYIRLPHLLVHTGTVSEGVATLGADAWHQAGLTGQGITGAIIDTGFAGWEDLQASGDLPAGDKLIRKNYKAEPLEASGQHGSAVAETFYDVAPGVSRLILYALDDDPDLGAIVDDMIAEGVHVAAMSLGWMNASPYDGSGFLCDQVDRARTEGDILWAIAAGNQAQMHYEAPFTSGDSSSYHEFMPGVEINQLGLLLQDTQLTVALSWDEWPEASSDYALTIMRWNWGNWSEAKVFDANEPTPTEGGRWTVPAADVYGIKIEKKTGEDRHLEFYCGTTSMLGITMDHQVAESSLLTPADADGAVAIGAVYYASPDQIEGFSSQGPRNASGGAPWIGDCPDPHCKPDLVGPDGNTTASYGDLPFFGTSAAAPHVAGAAALVRGAYPAYTASETQDFLADRATDLGEPGPDNTWGHGRVGLGEPPFSLATPTATATRSVTATVTTTPTMAGTATATPTGTPSPAPSRTPPTVTPTVARVDVYLPLVIKAASPFSEPTPTPAMAARLRIAPSPYQAVVGETFTLELTLDVAVKPVDAIEAFVDFSPAHLTVVDAFGQPTDTIEAGAAWDQVLWKQADNETGQIVFMARRQTPLPAQGHVQVATIRFRAEAPTAGTRLGFAPNTRLLSTFEELPVEMYDGHVIIAASNLGG